MLTERIYDKLTGRYIVLSMEDFLRFEDFLKRASYYVEEKPIEDKVIYHSPSLDVAEVEWAMRLCTIGYLAIEDRQVKRVTITRNRGTFNYSNEGYYTAEIVTVDIEMRDY